MPLRFVESSMVMSALPPKADIDHRVSRLIRAIQQPAQATGCRTKAGHREV
jgi:hypothetical protein